MSDEDRKPEQHPEAETPPGAPQPIPLTRPASGPIFTPGDRAMGHPEELTQKLAEISSIEEVLRIQDQLAKFVRERYEKPVAVLFSDIAGSTAYFEKYGDAEGRRMIQRHNDLLIPVVEQRGGRVVKTIGDAIMATFPSANLGADAAIGMMQAVHDANARVSHEEERFEIRIGINFGSALVNDKDGDVYGDMVNVAARVQSQANKNQILVSDVVREYLSPTVPVKPAGTFHLKGKSQDFQLYEVVWKDVVRPEIALQKPNLGARYVVLDLLGSGGMASVWRARDEKLGRDVAVKVLHGHMQLAFTTRERFSREAVVAASLVHDNIVQVYDYATQEAPQSFIAMELVEGQQLRNFMERHRALGTIGTLLIGNEIARGLAHAHARTVIHRDLKPENILISNTGTVKIGDFGIAGVGEMVRLTQAGAQLGTPAYLSPEQVKGGVASTRSDIFALGVMLYEMAAGKSPFEGDTASAIMFRIAEGTYLSPDQVAPVDPDLAALIRRCLAKDPKDRFATGNEVAVALSEALHRRGVGDPRASLQSYITTGQTPHTTGRITLDPALDQLPKRSRTPLLIAGAAVGVAALAGLAYVAWPTPQPPPAPPAVVAAAQEPTPEPPKAAPVEPAPVQPAAAQPEPEPQPVKPAIATATPRKERPRRERPKPSRLTEGEVQVSEVGERKVSEFGTLRLTVSGGWADIKVDGVKMGRYPTQRVFTLPEGGHVLELTGNMARKPHRSRILIEAGKTVEHAVELEPVAP